MRLSHVAAAVLLATGCGGRMNPPDYPDHIVGVDRDGKVLVEHGHDERMRTTFAGRIDRVYAAVSDAYTELGIPPTLTDRVEHRYGNLGFVFPASFAGGRTDEYFDCGSDITGQLAGRGRLVATVVTTLTADDSTTTLAATQVTGSLRRADGTSTRPVTCVSTGKMEERLRASVEKRLR